MCNQVLTHFDEQIGPSVSISANVRVGAGVRLINCIILDDVEVQVRKQMLERRLPHILYVKP